MRKTPQSKNPKKTQLTNLSSHGLIRRQNALGLLKTRVIAVHAGLSAQAVCFLTASAFTPKAKSKPGFHPKKW
jgi:hypothetical protein